MKSWQPGKKDLNVELILISEFTSFARLTRCNDFISKNFYYILMHGWQFDCKEMP